MFNIGLHNLHFVTHDADLPSTEPATSSSQTKPATPNNEAHTSGGEAKPSTSSSEAELAAPGSEAEPATSSDEAGKQGATGQSCEEVQSGDEEEEDNIPPMFSKRATLMYGDQDGTFKVSTECV